MSTLTMAKLLCSASASAWVRASSMASGPGDAGWPGPAPEEGGEGGWTSFMTTLLPTAARFLRFEQIQRRRAVVEDQRGAVLEEQFERLEFEKEDGQVGLLLEDLERPGGNLLAFSLDSRGLRV